MKVLRHIGSVAFVLGLFTAVFAGMPWYVMVADNPGGYLRRRRKKEPIVRM